ncbi:MAG: PAS-domain containing protein [Pseudolabrys sp.]
MFRDLMRLMKGMSGDATNGGADILDVASAEFKRYEQSFRLLFDSNPVPMWLMDIETLGFLAVNGAALKHYGYTREKFLTMTAVDIRLPEERHQFAQYLQSGANSQGNKVWRHLKANGEVVLVSVYSGDLDYAGRAARLCAVIDVTERMRTEDRLTEQKNQIDTALNNMSQGVLMFDRECRLMFCNRRYGQMYNLSPELVKPGVTLRQLVEYRKAVGHFSGDIDQYCRVIMTAIAKDTPTSRIIELADGRTIHAVDHPIAGGGWVATHEDITERKQAQAHLAKETNENRRLFEASLDLILMCDR